MKRMTGLGLALACGLGALTPTPAMLSDPNAYVTYGANRRRRGHWPGSLDCKGPSKRRAASKRAKQARKLHRKFNNG